MSTGVTLLEAALALAEDGMSLVPLYAVIEGVCACPDGASCPWPGKHPDPTLVAHGHLGATADAAVIRAWWETNQEANIGVRTGFYNGRGCLVVIDVDVKDGKPDGIAAFDTLRAGRELPATLTTITGTGGLHYFFWAGEEIRSRQPLVAGVDVKAKGGYVVAPPSRSSTGARYAPSGVSEIAALPGWLHELLTAPQGGSKRRSTPGGGGAPARSDRDWGSPVGVLADWDKRDDLMVALATWMKVGTDRFAPPDWYRRGDGAPSMQWFNDIAGAWILRDHGAAKYGTLPSLSLTEAYAAWLTHDPKRLGREQSALKARMLIEFGFLEQFAWTPPPATNDLSPLHRAYYDVLIHVTTCRWTLAAGEPVLCALEFSKLWGGLGPVGRASVGTLANARRAVVEAGLYYQVDELKRRGGGRRSPLLLPAGWPKQ